MSRQMVIDVMRPARICDLCDVEIVGRRSFSIKEFDFHAECTENALTRAVEQHRIGSRWWNGSEWVNSGDAQDDE